MGKEVRSVEMRIRKSDSEITNVTCIFPAGKSTFCNHIMARLVNAADHNLNQLNLKLCQIKLSLQLRQSGVVYQLELTK